jgi:hypothetical protein
VLRGDRERREQGRRERDGRVGRGEDQAVGLGEGASVHEVGDRRVAGREEKQGQALRDERDRVEASEGDERHEEDQGAHHEVARHHQDPPVEPVREHPSERGREDRREQPEHQDASHGHRGARELEGPGDEGEGPHPVAEGGDRLRHEQAAERAPPQGASGSGPRLGPWSPSDLHATHRGSRADLLPRRGVASRSA